MSGDSSFECVRKIFNTNQMSEWTNCKGYQDLFAFIRQLNEMAKSVHDGLYDIETVKEEHLFQSVALLNDLDALVDEIEPFRNDKGQRFGNKAFRLWIEQMKKKVDQRLSSYSPHDQAEIKPYIEDSFGNAPRIDYGTGHELSFIIYLMALYKLKIATPEMTEDQIRNASHQLLTIFAVKYLPLVRKIQLRYQLEPAGSHGVYSLDDFQFLPFLFGSSQLIDHPFLKPKHFPEQDAADAYADKFMFFAAIKFIHKVKKGPFHEHSNQLWNISGVNDWSRINKGIFKMYIDEVLTKFPIIQHLVFGDRVLKWTD